MGQDLYPAVPPKLIMMNIIHSLSRTSIRAVLVTDTAPVGFFAVHTAFGRPQKVHSPRVRLPHSHHQQLSVKRPSGLLFLIIGLHINLCCKIMFIINTDIP